MAVVNAAASGAETTAMPITVFRGVVAVNGRNSTSSISALSVTTPRIGRTPYEYLVPSSLAILSGRDAITGSP